LLINFGKSSLEYKRIINTHVKLWFLFSAN
jgi:hypothetical protein